MFLVDDHKSIIEGLSAVLPLMKHPDYSIEIVGNALDGKDAIAKIAANKEIDIVLLDVQLPVINGLKVVEILKRNKHCPKILMLSMHNSWAMATEAIDLLADGYILKESSASVIFEGILTIFQGNIFVDPAIRRGRNPVLFTDDELRIIHLTMEEYTAAGIAIELKWQRRRRRKKKPEEDPENKDSEFETIIDEDRVEQIREQIKLKMEVVNMVGFAVFALVNELYIDPLDKNDAAEKIWVMPTGNRRVINAMIVDDHAVMKDGLKHVLENSIYEGFQIRVVSTASNGQMALEAIGENFQNGAVTDQVDVVLMDIEMPIMNGLTATRQIKEQWPELKVIVLTYHGAGTMEGDVKESGADGFLSKTASSREIMEALVATVDGTGRIWSQGIDRPFFEEDELMVIKNVLLQKNNEKILEEFKSNKKFYTLSKISLIRQTVMKKMKVNNQVGFVKWAFRNGMSHFVT